MDTSNLVAEFRRELPWYLRCTQKTAQTSADNVRLFLEAQPEPFPACLTYENVMAWLHHLSTTPPRRRNKEFREPSTVNVHLKSLKRLARWALAREYISSNPIKNVKGLKEEDRVILAPAPEVIERVFQVARLHGSSDEIKARNLAMVCALIDIGPRAAEMVRMDVSDVLNEDGEFHHYIGADGQPHYYTTLHGKGGRDRMVALHPLVHRGLEIYLAKRRAVQGETALWLTESGTRMTYEAIRGVIQRICAKAGVSVSPHDFRRFAHTEMWMLDMDQINGMLLSGHSNQHVFQRYIRGGMAMRALREHSAKSPLEHLLRQGAG